MSYRTTTSLPAAYKERLKKAAKLRRERAAAYVRRVVMDAIDADVERARVAK